MPGSPRILRPSDARRALALATAGVLALTACGGSDDDDTAAPPTTTMTTTSAAPDSSPATGSSEAPASPDENGSEPRSLTATEVDFAIELANTDLEAGTYEVEVVNEGGASHDLVVERDGEDVAATEMIPPGESETLTVPLEPGEYVFYCSVGNHRAMGMEIAVTVT